MPSVSRRPLIFGESLPSTDLGAWTLWDSKTLLLSPICSSPFADGEIQFVENKNDPPGRAYLKLWEALTLLEKKPVAGDICLDLGSSPGSWTWVLAMRGANVISVDKAPLAANIAALPGVRFMNSSAFALNPEELGPVDWLCCDIACYPERLWKLIQRWLTGGTCKNYVCTVKLQGTPDQQAIAALADVPGSKLLHLSHNKHELTWLKTA